MDRRIQMEMWTLALYIAVFLCIDKDRGFRTAARAVRWYGNRMRDLGNWSWTQAHYADYAYKELIAP